MSVSFSTGFDWRQLPVDYPATYEQLNRNFNRVYGHAALRLVELCDLKSGNAAVDLGCGTGISTMPLLSAVGRTGFVLGLDPSAAMLEVACRQHRYRNVRFKLGDDLSLQVCSNRHPVVGYDAVISSFTFYYWMQRQEQTYRNVRDVLRHGGRWAFNTTSYLREVQHVGRTYNGFAAIYRRELDEELKSRGHVDGIGTDTSVALPTPMEEFRLLADLPWVSNVRVEAFRLPISPSDAYRWTIEGFYRFGSKPAISTKLAVLPLEERLDIVRSVLARTADEMDDTGENPVIFNFLVTTLG